MPVKMYLVAKVPKGKTSLYVENGMFVHQRIEALKIAKILNQQNKKEKNGYRTIVVRAVVSGEIIN